MPPTPSRPLFVSPRFAVQSEADFDSLPFPSTTAPRSPAVRSLIQLSDGAFLGSLRLNAKTRALEAVPAVNRAAAVRYPSAESAQRVIDRNLSVLEGATAVPVA